MKRTLWIVGVLLTTAAALLVALHLFGGGDPTGGESGDPGWDPTGSHPLPNRDVEKGPGDGRSKPHSCQECPGGGDSPAAGSVSRAR